MFSAPVLLTNQSTKIALLAVNAMLIVLLHVNGHASPLMLTILLCISCVIIMGCLRKTPVKFSRNWFDFLSKKFTAYSDNLQDLRRASPVLYVVYSILYVIVMANIFFVVLPLLLLLVARVLLVFSAEPATLIVALLIALHLAQLLWSLLVSVRA